MKTKPQFVQPMKTPCSHFKFSSFGNDITNLTMTMIIPRNYLLLDVSLLKEKWLENRVETERSHLFTQGFFFQLYNAYITFLSS